MADVTVNDYRTKGNDFETGYEEVGPLETACSILDSLRLARDALKKYS